MGLDSPQKLPAGKNASESPQNKRMQGMEGNFIPKYRIPKTRTYYRSLQRP